MDKMDNLYEIEIQMDKMDSLYEIEILLRFYYSPEKHLYKSTDAAAWLNNVDSLLRKGLIVPYSGEPGYSVTERGRVYVEAIRSVPLPVQSWIMPTTQTKKG